MCIIALHTNVLWAVVQRGAQRGGKNITKAMDSVLNLPARATQVDTSVHGQPVAGIVSTPEGGELPTLLRSNTLLMQKVSNRLTCLEPT